MLYEKSKISLFVFNVMFMAIIVKLSISEAQAKILYEFIKLILPVSNNLEESYYRFKKSFDLSKVKEIRLCQICHFELKNHACPSESCLSHRLEKKINIKKSIKVVVADVKSQLLSILTQHYESIIKYQSKTILYFSLLI